MSHEMNDKVFDTINDEMVDGLDKLDEDLKDWLRNVGKRVWITRSKRLPYEKLI